MMQFRRKALSALASGALLLNILASTAFAQTTLEISGNGSGSENDIEVTATKTVTVVQQNDADIDNDVDVTTNTGGNSANDNTNGDVTIDTGNATTRVDLYTLANLNHADVVCDTCGGNTTVQITGNGSGSENEVELGLTNDTSVFQANDADVDNDVDASANTGNNDADRNTGGDVTLITGHASTDARILTAANANRARVGTGGSNGTAGLNVQITGNGSGSENEFELTHDRLVTLVQENDADIDNDVDASANTGNNSADDNTGGDILVGTGNADTDVRIRNLANFNTADVSCGCFTTNLTADVSGNGSNSENEMEAYFTDLISAFQGENENGGNSADIDNNVDPSSDTGYNDTNRNTGPANYDPAVLVSGHAESNVSLHNQANANLFGSGLNLNHFPELPLQFTFNLGSVLGFFGLVS